MALADIEPDIRFVAPAAEANIEIGRWCFDHMGQYDVSLLGAFEYAMKQRNCFGGTESDLTTWFEAFEREPADAESQVLATQAFVADRATTLARVTIAPITDDDKDVSA